MTMEQLLAKPTPTNVRMFYESRRSTNEPRYFFDRDTMRFFGDTMKSFGARRIDGKVYLYRKPSARVNVFGTWKTAGRDFFNAWHFDPETYDLHNCSTEETSLVYQAIS